MTLGEGFLLLVRWFHSLAAVAWIGGSIFYVLVLRPAQRRAGVQAAATTTEVQIQFRGLVDSCIAVLLVTGAVMLFDRLTDATTGTAYVVAVAVKIGLALWMFAMARGRWRRRRASANYGSVHAGRPTQQAVQGNGPHVRRQPERHPGHSHLLPVRPAAVPVRAGIDRRIAQGQYDE